MNTALTFIILDDDTLNNKLCRYLIQKVTPPETEIVDFTSHEKVLSYILSSYSETSHKPTILMLDSNMPQCTGWEFLELFKQVPDYIRNQICIYMVTSSIDNRDKQKANANPFVQGYIEKPVSLHSIEEAMRHVMQLS